MKIKNVNDILALAVMLAVIPGLWIVDHWLKMPGEIIGATIAVWTLVAQFYFRRSPPAPPATGA